MVNHTASTPLARSRRARLKNQETVVSLNEEQLLLESPEQPVESVEAQQYAGFWVRFWAFLLDMLVLFSLNSLFIRSWFVFLDDGVQSIGPFATLTFIQAGTFFLYFALMTKFFGKTIGKMVLGIKVVSADGSPLTWKQIIFREGIVRLVYHIQIFTISMFMWLYLFVAFVPTKRGLHDLVADTMVVHDKK